MAGSDLPFVRADWFIATASRPPLYHTMLELPEQRQGPGEEAQRRRRERLPAATAWRGPGSPPAASRARTAWSIATSALHGAYWKSYDFKTNEGKGNLFRFPLGPNFTEQPVPRPGLRERRRRDHLQPAQRPARLFPHRRQGQAHRRRAGRGRQRRAEDLRHAGHRHRPVVHGLPQARRDSLQGHAVRRRGRRRRGPPQAGRADPAAGKDGPAAQRGREPCSSRP